MIRTTRTAAETAAFKAANLAQDPEVVYVNASDCKPARKSQRQEYTELLAETRQMIAAAKRQGCFHAIPALVQRAATFQSILDNRAIA